MADQAPPNTQTTAAKHTPGPWTAITGQGVHHRDWYIRADTGRDDGAKPAVAKTCSTGIGSMATVEANARLIAAAPDLLAACRDAALCFGDNEDWWVDAHDRYLTNDDPSNTVRTSADVKRLVLEHLIAAIARAEGRA